LKATPAEHPDHQNLISGLEVIEKVKHILSPILLSFSLQLRINERVFSVIGREPSQCQSQASRKRYEAERDPSKTGVS